MISEPAPTPGRRPLRLVVVGAGGHGRVVADVAARAGFDVIGFCDPSYAVGARINGIGVLARDERELLKSWPEGVVTIVALGDNERRLALSARFEDGGIGLATVVDPSAVVSAHAAIGRGSVVMPLAVVNADSALGMACIVNSGAVVEHGAQLGDGVHIAPRACIAGEASIGHQVMVGAGAVVLPSRRIGRGAVVGAGAVVTHDVGEALTVAGSPARPISVGNTVQPRGALH